MSNTTFHLSGNLANMVKEGRENERKGGRFVNVTKKSYQMKMQSHRRKYLNCERKRVSGEQAYSRVLAWLMPNFRKNVGDFHP